MWPWGHLAVGYLCYVAIERLRSGRRPRGRPLAALALGTQFPDLVDKPLSWLSLVPAGRSLAHSLLAAALLAALAVALSRRYSGRPLGVAFGVGYLTHLLADAVRPLWLGAPGDLAFLLWPVVALPPENLMPYGEYVSTMALSPYSLVQLALVALALAAWMRGGTPARSHVRDDEAAE